MTPPDSNTEDRPQMDLLRFATAGSVDDGKSTLIGRLLLDSKAIFEDQLESVEATSRGARLRLHRPRPAHRRPALRARAGHHDRRRLPLLRHPEAQVHHRRHPRPRAVHAQHGHGSVDGEPRPRPRRRPQRPHRAVAPSRRHPVAAAGAAHRAGHQQDGPRRLRPEGLRRDRARLHVLRLQADGARPRGHPASRP